MGARCYPAGSRVVIFIQGYYTTYDEGGTQATIVEGQRFNVLKNEFASKGYARAAMLDFSYAGGGVTQDGTWRPNPYPCELTDRRSDDNLKPLETMLRDYGAHHPNAHFTLVGHSLGGYLAFLEGARESGRTKAAKLGIDAVVTLDAPLLGASPLSMLFATSAAVSASGWMSLSTSIDCLPWHTKFTLAASASAFAAYRLLWFCPARCSTGRRSSTRI